MSEIIETSATMNVTDLQSVWEVIRDIESYPQFMPGVLAARIVERVANTTRSEWTTVLNGNEMSWLQEDTEDSGDGVFSSAFTQLEGDIELWRGETTVRRIETGEVEVNYRIEFDLGIPAMTHVLHPLAARAIRANCTQMLDALRSRLEKDAAQ